MNDLPHKRSLKTALNYQRYDRNPYRHRAKDAANQFNGKWFLPILILCIGVQEYVDKKIRRAKEKHREQDHEDLEKDALQANRIISTFTVILAVIGFAGAVVSLFTLLAIKGQLSEMQSSSGQTDKIIAADKDLAAAAKDQAVAATTLAKETKESVELSERAWLGPINAKIDAVAIGQPINATVDYQNTGKQPAETQIVFAQQLLLESEYLNIKTGYALMQINQEGCRKSEKFTPYSVAFPIQQPNFYVSYSNSKDLGFVAAADLVSGKKVDIIFGCIIYNNFLKTRHTFFAYYYKAGVTKDLGHLNFYPFIGYAD